jgi:hypothetical protein
MSETSGKETRCICLKTKIVAEFYTVASDLKTLGRGIPAVCR